MKLTNVKTVKNLEKVIEGILADTTTSKSLKMKQLFELGLEIKDIALKMGVRYNFVYNVISNQIIVEGLVVETEKKESKKDLVRELFNQGKSNKEIAIELKTNYNYIYKLTKEIKDDLLLEEVAITK
jgi:DNA invertase Pin-like site-specific DNA recombinase